MRKPQWVEGTSVFLTNRVPSTRAWAAPLVFLLALASPAHADDKAKAASHYKQGKAFFEAKNYAQAIVEYKAAYAIDKLPAHLFNIARAYHLAGELDLAIEHYQKFLDADPTSPNAPTARTEIVAATKLRDERKADEAAKKQKEELEKKRALVDARVKQAKAYEQAGAWASAADEYVAAGEHDPEQLLAAVDAYRKVPDLAKARSAYVAYLDRVPAGPRSDQVRKDLALITREIEVAARSSKPAERPVDKPEPAPVEPVRLGLTRWGFRLGAVLTQGTSNPLQGMKEGQGLVAGFGLEGGLILRYQITPRFAVRPELTVSTRTSGYDSETMNDAVEIHRGGATVGGVALYSATPRGGVQLGGGAEVGAMVVNKANVNDGTVGNIDGFKPFDLALLGAVVFDFGRAAIELRYRRSLTHLAEEFGTGLQSVSVGFSVTGGL